MSRKYEAKTDNRTYEALTEMLCDLCGRSNGRPRDNWAIDPYQIQEAEVSLIQGWSYPSSYVAKKWSIDICPECFKTKLMPWAEAQGATFREVNS